MRPAKRSPYSFWPLSTCSFYASHAPPHPKIPLTYKLRTFWANFDFDYYLRNYFALGCQFLWRCCAHRRLKSVTQLLWFELSFLLCLRTKITFHSKFLWQFWWSLSARLHSFLTGFSKIIRFPGNPCHKSLWTYCWFGQPVFSGSRNQGFILDLRKAIKSHEASLRWSNARTAPWVWTHTFVPSFKCTKIRPLLPTYMTCLQKYTYSAHSERTQRIKTSKMTEAHVSSNNSGQLYFSAGLSFAGPLNSRCLFFCLFWLIASRGSAYSVIMASIS